jgi:predicted DNA binding CopG/RHH family protein
MPKKSVIRRPKSQDPVSFTTNNMDVPQSIQPSFSEEEDMSQTEPRARPKVEPQMKTLRLDPTLFQAVKVVAKSLGMTEQDYIIEAIRKETQLHIVQARQSEIARLTQLPTTL